MKEKCLQFKLSVFKRSEFHEIFNVDLQEPKKVRKFKNKYFVNFNKNWSIPLAF